MYQVRSTNFDFHQPLTAATFVDAVALAKTRGFEASIYKTEPGWHFFVASWSPLCGLNVYDRKLAGFYCSPADRVVSERVPS